ncbi:UNVERIFIED_CONTAM: hypothetical protein K2H54_043402 [Gekko kuhli]
MRDLETDGSQSRSPSDGPPWLPRMVILLILGNAFGQAIIGPLDLSLVATNDNLTVVISLPPTPWADDNSSTSFVDIRKFSYQMTLIEEGAELYNKTVLFMENIYICSYPNLVHSANYCVKAKATNQPAKESIQCIRMPGRPAGRAGFVMASVIVIGFILLSMMSSIVAGTVFKHHTQQNPSKTFFPKSMTFLNPELNGNPPTLSPVLHLEEDCIVSVSVEVLPSESNTALQLSPRGCSAQVWSTYCARGFDASSWSSDFLSSGELEYPTGEDYRPAPELPGPSAHLSPSSARLLPHDDAETRCIIQNWECEIGRESRLTGSSSSSRADIPFNSVKLQAMVDILYSPETYLVRTDRDTPQGTPAQQTIESEAHHEPHGFPKASDFLDDSSLELRDTRTVPFSGYEFRQPILFCE